MPVPSLRPLLSCAVVIASLAVAAPSLQAGEELATRPAATGAPEDPKGLMADATKTAKKFIDDPTWSALRNMLGGATAVAFFPDLTEGGFIVAAEGGSGVMFVRHGATWSDPVFIELASASFGLQAGVEVIEGVLVLMSDDGPQRLLTGAFGMGGQASIAVADLGLGGGTSGNRKTGINSFMVSYGEGLFAGGAIGGSQITQNKEYNTFVYGAGYDARKITAGSTGKVANAEALRKLLGDATARAWKGN